MVLALPVCQQAPAIRCGVSLWYHPHMVKIFLGILAIGIPIVFFVISALRFKSTPPNYRAGSLFALLGLAIVGLEVLLLIWAL